MEIIASQLPFTIADFLPSGEEGLMLSEIHNMCCRSYISGPWDMGQ